MDGHPMIDDEVGAHTRVTVLAYWKNPSPSSGVGHMRRMAQ
jgi:hypothetical protein